MKTTDIKFLIDEKVRRLESLRSKSYFSKTYGDIDNEAKLEKEIKELERKLEVRK